MNLFGKTGLNENSVLMHFKCILNALIMHWQCVDNGSQHICNVIQSIVKALTMFNKSLRMDEKCFSTR